MGARGSKKIKSQEVIVTPNQQAVFNPESKVLNATLVQNPVTLSKPEKTQQTKTKEIFDEEPIINILQKWSGPMESRSNMMGDANQLPNYDCIFK